MHVIAACQALGRGREFVLVNQSAGPSIQQCVVTNPDRIHAATVDDCESARNLAFQFLGQDFGFLSLIGAGAVSASP